MCDSGTYSQTDPALSGFLGALSSLAGLIGISGFWDPVNQDSLKQAQLDYKNLQTKLNQAIADEQQILSQQQKDYSTIQSQLLQTNISLTDDLLKDKIVENQLAISIIICVLMIIIFYLVVL